MPATTATKHDVTAINFLMTSWLGLFYGLDHDLRTRLNGPATFGYNMNVALSTCIRLYVYRPTKSDGLMTYGLIGVVAAATLLSALS